MPPRPAHARLSWPCALLLLLAPPAQLVAASSALAASETGVVIYSLTNGADIVIDGILVGTVPFEGLIALEPGQHTIQVRKRGFAERTEIVDLRRGDELELELDLVPFSGVVRVTSNLPAADLWVDGRPYGPIPFDGEIPIGEHVVRAVALGHVPVERQLQVEAGQEYTLHFDLPIADTPPPAVTEAPSIFQRWWFWTAAGVALAGGVAAAVVLASADGGAPPPSPEADLTF